MATASALPLPLQLPTKPAYASQATLTPPDSDTSSPRETTSSSPRSLQYSLPAHLQLQSKQLRTPRSPMYVPAVLRPTEKPARQSPPTRSGQVSANGIEQDEDINAPEGDTVSVRRVVTEEWNETSLGDVTGPPSRNHWKPDPSSPTCDFTICSRPFSFFQRRHHCRRCGSIFCAQHTMRQVPLDQHARFNQSAPPYRACDDCYRDFRVWDSKRVQRPARTGSADGVVNAGNGSAVEINPGKKGIMGSIAQSVPRDWSWSTF